MRETAPTIRLASLADEEFILALAPRFAQFPLPAWRRPQACVDGIRERLRRCLEDAVPNSHLFVAEDAHGERAGLIHLQRSEDLFTGRGNCHIADLAVAATHEGRGIARALLHHAQDWARKHRCELLTLAVFPGNARARKLYAAAGFDTDLLRLAKPLR